VYLQADSSVLGYLPTVIADLVLLLVTLAGLFILRQRGSGMSGLTRLLWKQVRCRFSLAVVFFSTLLILLHHKGVIWLVLGTAVVVPPVVSAASLSFLPFLYISRLHRRRYSPRCIQVVCFPLSLVAAYWAQFYSKY
jgi:hypothetical protein